MTAREKYEQLLGLLQNVRRMGTDRASARCPAHEDTRASLSASLDEARGRVLLKCHAGCPVDRVLSGLGLTFKDLSGNGENRETPRSAAEAVYDYCDQDGTLLYQVVRLPGKRFVQRRPATAEDLPQAVRDDSDGRQWVYKVAGTRKVLYRLGAVQKAVGSGQPVFIVEGEKDADAGANAMGLATSCNAGGAGKWRTEYAQFLRGADVVVVPDNDTEKSNFAGQRHAMDVVQSLEGLARAVRVLELPGDGVKDLSDWIARGGNAEGFELLVQAAVDGQAWSETWRPRLKTGRSGGAKPRAQAARGGGRQQDRGEREDGTWSHGCKASSQGPSIESAGSLVGCTNLLDASYAAMVALGLVGEQRNAKVLVLAVVSRVLSRPVNIFFMGESSSGKTWVVKVALQLLPEGECWHKYNGASAKAFVYTDADFKHRVLFLNEVDAFATAARDGQDNAGVAILRSLIEGNQLEYEVVVRGEGGFTTQRVSKEGPTGAIFTGCHAIDEELMNRCLVLTPDERAEQTRGVKMALAARAANPDVQKPGVEAFHALNQYLQAKAPWSCVIPYAPHLVVPGKGESPRWRRDFETLLTLIKAHAVLHFGSRENLPDGSVVATIDDYRAVYDIAAAAFPAEQSGLTAKQVEAVQAVRDLAAGETTATVKAVGTKLRLASRSAVQKRLEAAERAGYVRKKPAPPGAAVEWVPGDDLPSAASALPTPEEVEALASAPLSAPASAPLSAPLSAPASALESAPASALESAPVSAPVSGNEIGGMESVEPGGAECTAPEQTRDHVTCDYDHGCLFERVKADRVQLQEYLGERAAVREYEAGMGRTDADTWAFADLVAEVVRRYSIPVALLGQTEAVLRECVRGDTPGPVCMN